MAVGRCLSFLDRPTKKPRCVRIDGEETMGERVTGSVGNKHELLINRQRSLRWSRRHR
jgi:hypothetical protein